MSPVLTHTCRGKTEGWMSRRRSMPGTRGEAGRRAGEATQPSSRLGAGCGSPKRLLTSRRPGLRQYQAKAGKPRPPDPPSCASCRGCGTGASLHPCSELPGGRFPACAAPGHTLQPVVAAAGSQAGSNEMAGTGGMAGARHGSKAATRGLCRAAAAGLCMPAAQSAHPDLQHTARGTRSG